MDTKNLCMEDSKVRWDSKVQWYHNIWQSAQNPAVLTCQSPMVRVHSHIFCSTHVYIFVLAVPRCKDLPLLSLLIFTTRLFPPSCWFWICSSDVTNDVALTWRNIHLQTASDFGVASNRTLELTIGLWHWPSGFGVLHIYTEMRVHL